MMASKRPLAVVLGILQVLIGIGALPAGLLLVIEPSGAGLGMQTEWLAGSPFTSFLIPGLFLFAVNGLGSLIGAWMAFRQHRHASLLAVGLGAFLMAWITVQTIILGPPVHWLQASYFVLGAVEVLLGWRLDSGALGRLLRSD